VQAYLDKGWSQLVMDNDTTALKLFSNAFIIAEKNNDTKGKAEALLYLGITSYGSSLSNGLSYALKALSEFKKLEKSQPDIAGTGRGKCLQLIGTIKAREGKLNESLSLSLESAKIMEQYQDTTATLGIAYTLLGNVYNKLNKKDSAEFYFKKALRQHQSNNSLAYLPVAYCNVAAIALQKNQAQSSKSYYELANAIADSTLNRQAKVGALTGLGKWYLTVPKDYRKTDSLLAQALKIANGLTDKAYLIKVLTERKNLQKIQGNFAEALKTEEQITVIKDSVFSREKEHVTRSLELQFDIAEKERIIESVKRENAGTKRTNYYLCGIILTVCLTSFLVFVLLKRINKRDKLLLKTKDELMEAIEDKKKTMEQKMSNEIEFRESQLSALTIQMVQKNDLLLLLKEKLDSDKNEDTVISKIINKGLNQDKEWDDFNAHFESINKNFYTRIKQAFPSISPNELRVCALIKMNLSIKEMASILNISPDSVKTARYRLRKKLQLNTEDNLTEFILNLE
jgi:DNA-binding CsgD family transcriptional regulator